LSKCASANLGLRALQCSLLRTRAKPSKLLRRASAHRIALLTETGQLLAQLLHSLTVSLFRTKAHALLLLGCLKSLLITLLIQRSDSLRLRKALLAAQCLPLQASAVAAIGTSPNSFSLLLGKLLALLLAHSSLRSPYNALREGIHVATNLKPLRAHRRGSGQSRTSSRSNVISTALLGSKKPLRGCAIVWLG
jgi:hypothetical protein